MRVSTAIIYCALIIMLCISVCAADPAYIYGMHDFGGESDMASMGTKGWIVDSAAIGHNPGDYSGFNYANYTNNGYGVIARLNNGYGSDGTLPYQANYADFAQRCANYVANSPGCHIWIIGNETNLPREWPGNNNGDPATGEPITVARYASCYNLCYTAITSLSGHSGDQIIPTAVGTWAPPYSAQGIDAFDDYFVNLLNTLGTSKVKGIALHVYTHGTDPNLIYSEALMGSPYQDIHYNFRVYKDYMSRIPSAMRSLPCYITETGQDQAWADTNSGWMTNAYSEINTWNQTSGNQKIRCLAPFRWLHAGEGDAYYICDRANVRADWRAAMGYQYTWTTVTTTGTITGSVKDASNAAVSGATVSAGGFNTTTDSSGNYTLSNVTTGTYIVTASKTGYDTTTQTGVVVTTNGTTTVNLTISLSLMNTNTPTGVNWAPSSTAVSTNSSFSSSFDGWKAIDGSLGTKWCTATGVNPPHYLALDLGGNRTINGYIVRHAQAGGESYTMNTIAFSIQTGTSIDGPWTDQTVVDNSAQASVTARSYNTPKVARYVRLYITNSGVDTYARIYEFEVWGSSTIPDSTPPTVSNIVPTPACVKTNGTVSVSANVTDNAAINQSGIYLISATNLLTNPSFETGDLTGWTHNQTSGNNEFAINGTYATPANVKNGTKYTGCSQAGGGNNPATPEIRQTVPVTPGQLYSVSVWTVSNGTPNPCTKYLKWYDGTPSGNGQGNVIASTTYDGTTWQQLSGYVTPTTSSLTVILYLSITGTNGGGGAGYFDLAEVRQCISPSTYTSNVATWNNQVIPASYAFPVYAKDNAGNTTLATSSTPVTTDDAAPNSFTPVANPSGWTSGNVSVTFSTTDSGCSGMNHYEVAVDSGSYATQTSPYTMTQTGSHVVHVKAVDNAGNSLISNVNTYIDSSAPTTPVVTDDGVYTTSISQLHATWTSTDADSGIAEYQYAIGTTSGGTDTVGWTSTGTTASFTRTGLTLQYDKTYYISVKAKNAVGSWSTIGTGDGITAARSVATIWQAKGYPDASAVQLVDKPVTARIGSSLWIEESDRSPGIRVNTSLIAAPGAKVTVTGKLLTTDGERSIDQAVATQNGTITIPKAVGVSNSFLGGDYLNAYTPGVSGGGGANNIGLFVITWGRVTQIGTGYLYINDGANLTDGTRTGAAYNVGVRIICAPAGYATGDYLIVTGISSCFNASVSIQRQVLTRSSSDVVKISTP